ncbi:hypothetical protein SUGI_0438660 [Cryptomeria japonica]|nr:hypothetical protein SUGI_0438660 [Cryptomeria japonica]
MIEFVPANTLQLYTMTDQRQLHVLKFPWLAHGHITPFLELAKSLTSYGLKISFLSTQLDIERIKQKLQPSLGIRQVQLPIPSVDGLPTGVNTGLLGLPPNWEFPLYILSHPSTGASLTHCAWTSITEGLRFGAPYVALPVQYDQGLNARLISEEFKVGVEVRRNEEDGSFTKEDIARAV